LVKFSWTESQFRFLAEFCVNAAVAWFVVAFVAPADLLTSVRGIVNMVAMLILGLKILEELKK